MFEACDEKLDTTFSSQQLDESSPSTHHRKDGILTGKKTLKTNYEYHIHDPSKSVSNSYSTASSSDTPTNSSASPQLSPASSPQLSPKLPEPHLLAASLSSRQYCQSIDTMSESCCSGPGPHTTHSKKRKAMCSSSSSSSMSGGGGLAATAAGSSTEMLAKQQCKSSSVDPGSSGRCSMSPNSLSYQNQPTVQHCEMSSMTKARIEVCTAPPGADADELNEIECYLETDDLWKRFYELGTEMIITKSGRRMFPPLRVSFLGVRQHQKYIVAMDIVPTDSKRYRYAYHRSSWLVAGKADPPVQSRLFVHPDGPFTGDALYKQIVSFEKVKLTNNEMDKSGHVSFFFVTWLFFKLNSNIS